MYMESLSVSTSSDVLSFCRCETSQFFFCVEYVLFYFILSPFYVLVFDVDILCVFLSAKLFYFIFLPKLMPLPTNNNQCLRSVLNG